MNVPTDPPVDLPPVCESGCRVVVAGGRQYRLQFADYEALDQLHRLRPMSLLIHGDCAGCDRDAGVWAKSRGIPVERVPAQWDKHGRAAGPIRNREMAAAADVVVLFPGGRGTESMRREAEAAGCGICDWRKGTPDRDSLRLLDQAIDEQQRKDDGG